RDVWRQTLSIRIGAPHDLCDGNPIAFQERVAHLLGRIANALKNFKEFRVTIDMALENLPVIDSRKTRLAGIANHKSAIDLVFINRQMLALDPVGSQVNTRGRTVERRIIILD